MGRLEMQLVIKFVVARIVDLGLDLDRQGYWRVREEALGVVSG